MTAPPLDTRVIRILHWLLDQTETRGTAALAEDLGLSQRVVRYRLDAVDRFLRSHGMSLVRRRGSGVWVAGTPDERAALRRSLVELTQAPRVYAREERDHVLVADLLWCAPDPTSLDHLHDSLEVSVTSARRDLKRNEAWLERQGLVLVRRPGVGVAVVGPETKIRQALVQLTVEAVPEDVLEELSERAFADARLVRMRVPAGMRDHLAKLPLEVAAGLVRSPGFGGILAEGSSEMVFAVYLAVTAARLARGAGVSLDTGQQRSLADHPVSGTARFVAARFERAFGVELSEAEVAVITRYLLGLATLSSPDVVESHDTLVDALVREAACRLHESLATDAELRRSLSEHLDRLAVRLRYGLPVHNPLLDQVSARYPDVHAVAIELGRTIGEHFSAPISEAEIGYVTMYLAGALERPRLRSVRRAVVVCPSGMATVWVLVSRVRAEFPQLEVVKVLSSRSYEELDHADVDLVISTVEIPPGSVPVVVVNPLLSAADVRRVADRL